YMNQRDENRKKCNANMTEELEDSLQSLYVEDLAKVYQECSFTYNPKSNDLSILSMKDKIISIIETNSVVIIQGPTGCGKTTQIPQFILDANIKKRLNCNIIVTQPRRIAAISIAKRVSQEGNWRLGSLVGYQVGMQKEISHETRLTYCTTEILLQYLIHNKHMLDYTHVILDEIHERDQNLDFLLLVVKRLLQTNSGQVKVILMSATINVIKFAKYFSSIVENELIPAPILKIPRKKNFEFRTYYLDEIKNLGNIPEVSVMEPKVTQEMLNFCSLIINALDEIDINDNEKDLNLPQRHAVLIFLPGIYEIEELYNYLSSTYHQNKLWDLTILHSLVSDDHEQHRVFQKPLEGYRRIILSTNIAESSITVPDVKYVIDFCLTKLLTFDPATHYQSLQLCWASKTNCIQRAGRTGRVMDGRVYRLIPKAFYDNILDDYCVPEILRAPLANVVLRAKILDLDEPRVLLSHSLDPPTLSNLANTILSLKEVGALIDEGNSFQMFDGSLTDLGRVMAILPLDIRISKLIILGHVFGVLRDAIILGASMTIKDVFSLEQCHPTVSSYTTRKKWAYGSDSDCIATLNVYKMWQNEKANRRINSYQAERQWAQRNGFQARALRELDALVTEITIRLQRFGIKESIGVNKVIWQGADRDFVLQIILAGAFYPNYFIKRLQNREVYKENVTMTLGSLDPMKTIYLRGWPMKQPGYLYAKRFQEVFAKHQGILEKQIEVSFDGSQRVYVHFRERETADNYPKPPKEEDCTSSVNLQGPFSPLEMELIQLTLGGRLKKINVDMKSVNSVLLDDDLNQSRRLLIAQSTTQSNKNSLTLRNTTFLPNIPGLAALLTLSFAPRMELRCNSRRTYYTGALCGLGPKDNFTNRAIFPDHDIEIQFDVEITIDDVKEINKLRHWMNTAMQLDNSSDEDIILYQNKIKHILLELKEKQRQSRNPEDDEIDQLNDKWNRYNGPHFLPSVRENVRRGDVYPLHKALELRETNEQMEEMLKHLSQLQSLAYEDASVVRNVAAFCKLCGTETFGLLQLRNHLYSEQHAENEKLLHRQLHEEIAI
ncbi:putative ATP-dependent RNA helicase spindle-E, partial [Atta colombica]